MALGFRLPGEIDAAHLLDMLHPHEEAANNTQLELTNSQSVIMEQAVHFVVANNQQQQQHHHQQQQEQPNHVNPNCNPGFYRDHWTQTPCLDDLDTDFKFEVQVPMDDKEKKLWYYDPEEKLLFVKGEQPLTAIVSYKPNNTPLFLRLMPVYTSLADVRNSVNRCPNHKNNCRTGHSHHLVHCQNEGVQYMGSEMGGSFAERMSLVIPMQRSMNPMRFPEQHLKEEVCFSIMCLNSCSGIMRRSTAIIFTLETRDCEIVGRTVMNFRACTSPKRDFEERAKKKRRGDGTLTQPSAKRPMIVKNVDGSVTTVKKEGGLESSQESDGPSPSGETTISICLPNKKYALQVMKGAQDFLSGEVTRGHRVDKKYFKILGKQIEEITKELKK